MVTLQIHVSTILNKSAKTASDEIVNLFDSCFKAFTEELRQRQEEIENLKKTLEAAELASQLTSVNSATTYLCGKCGVRFNSVILLGENQETTDTNQKPAQDLQTRLSDQLLGQEPIEDEDEEFDSVLSQEMDNSDSEQIQSDESTNVIQTTIIEELTYKEESVLQETGQRRRRGRPRKPQKKNRGRPRKAEVSLTLKRSKTVSAKEKRGQLLKKKSARKPQAIQPSQAQSSVQHSISGEESQTTTKIELGSQEPLLITCASNEEFTDPEVPPKVTDSISEQIQSDENTGFIQTTCLEELTYKEESYPQVISQKRRRGRPRKHQTEPVYNGQKGTRERRSKSEVSVTLKRSKTFSVKGQQKRGQLLKKKSACKLQAVQPSQAETSVQHSISEEESQTTTEIELQTDNNRSSKDLLEPPLLTFASNEEREDEVPLQVCDSYSVGLQSDENMSCIQTTQKKDFTYKEESAPQVPLQNRRRGRPKKHQTEPDDDDQKKNRGRLRKAEVSVTLKRSKTFSVEGQQKKGQLLKKKSARKLQAVQPSQAETSVQHSISEEESQTTTEIELEKNNNRSPKDLLKPPLINFAAPIEESEGEELTTSEMPPEQEDRYSEQTQSADTTGCIQTNLKEDLTYQEDTSQVISQKRGRGRPSKLKSEPLYHGVKRGRGRPRKEEMSFTFKKFKRCSGQQQVKTEQILSKGSTKTLQAMQHAQNSYYGMSEETNKTSYRDLLEPLIMPFGEAMSTWPGQRSHMYRSNPLKTEPEELASIGNQRSTLENCQKNKDEKKAEQIRKSSFACPKCPRIFRTKKKLQAHAKFHLKKSEVKCSICGMTFIGKIQMDNHIKVHTGEKPFSCNVCPARFINMSQFKKHMMKHTAPDFACEVCGLRASHVPKDAFRKVHLRIKEPCSNCALIYT